MRFSPVSEGFSMLRCLGSSGLLGLNMVERLKAAKVLPRQSWAPSFPKIPRFSNEMPL